MTDHNRTQPELSAMSRHHVLHAMAVLPTLPRELTKALLLLAMHADHRTGLARPGRTVITKRWGIPYSTWFRHVRRLEALGLVQQVVAGNDKSGKAAEYELLYVGPDATGGIPSGSGKGSDGDERQLPSLTGGDATRENGAARQPELTPDERRAWDALRERIKSRLSPEDRARLECAGPGFDQLTALKRSALRVAETLGTDAVVRELTRSRPGRSAYHGVRDVLPAMWRRLADLADTCGVDMRDTSPVTPPTNAADVVAELGIKLRTGLTDIC